MRRLDILGHDQRVVWVMAILTGILMFFELTGVAGMFVDVAALWSLFSVLVVTMIDKVVPQLSSKYRHRMSISLIAFVILYLCVAGVQLVFLH